MLVAENAVKFKRLINDKKTVQQAKNIVIADLRAVMEAVADAAEEPARVVRDYVDKKNDSSTREYKEAMEKFKTAKEKFNTAKAVMQTVKQDFSKEFNIKFKVEETMEIILEAKMFVTTKLTEMLENALNNPNEGGVDIEEKVKLSIEVITHMENEDWWQLREEEEEQQQGEGATLIAAKVKDVRAASAAARQKLDEERQRRRTEEEQRKREAEEAVAAREKLDNAVGGRPGRAPE